MRRWLVIVVAALACCWGVESHAEPQPQRAAHAVKKNARRVKHRLRRTVKSDRRRDDELVLSPALVRELQHHLADAGYFDGPADGVLSARTRKALGEFQHDYHQAGNGALTRASAEALLGRDRIGAFTASNSTRSTL